MKTYLTTLIEEKGFSTSDEITMDGHYGLTWDMLIEFIGTVPEYHRSIKNTLVKIDFKNGDVFHYLNHLAVGMVKSCGY